MNREEACLMRERGSGQAEMLVFSEGVEVREKRARSAWWCAVWQLEIGTENCQRRIEQEQVARAARNREQMRQRRQKKKKRDRKLKLRSRKVAPRHAAVGLGWPVFACSVMRGVCAWNHSYLCLRCECVY